jgi:hypothetical protein
LTVDLLVNLVASLIAFLLGLFTRSAYHRIRTGILRRNRARILDQRRPSFTRRWLVDYYTDAGHADDLYAVRHEAALIRVPLLVKPSWHLHGAREADLISQTLPQRLATVPVDQRALKKRSRYLSITDKNGDPWNDLIACVAGVREAEDGPHIDVQLAEYYQYLSACGPLEDETFRAIRNRRAKSRVRDGSLGSAGDAALCKLGAHPFGMQVAVVFGDGERYKILIQRRSYSVSSYGGALAVVPVFGCQTTDMSANTEVSLFHNFLREVYEELYGGVEAERRTSRVDSRWFYKEAPIARLLKASDEGLLDFRLLGFGFDALNGELDLQAIALFHDSRFTQIELSEMSTNWEINDIQVWDLFGDDLTDAVLAGEFSPGSVYAIMQGREYLSQGWADRHEPG